MPRACDRQSKAGELDKALDQSSAHNWPIVDMKRNWKTMFAPEK